MNARILIIDDEATIRASLQESLAAEGHEVETAESGEEALARIHNHAYDLVITDLRLPGVSGLEVMQALRNQGNPTPVIMMTAYGDVDSAIEAMKLGAYDYVKKPFKLGEMRKQVKAALRATPDRQEAAPAGAPEERPGRAAKVPGDEPYMRMIRACPGLAKVANLLAKVGSSKSGNDTSILITGESGSGKEIVARAVHEASQGRGHRFMEINCAAVPETLLESELFGYEKGAFTDAKTRKEGLFELAGSGTIFLDEIGEMGILLQSRLLRVLENRRFRRVGGKDDNDVRARIVAATNRRLGDAIAQGAFRNDLYYRLQVVEIDVPPLRERPEDLRVLIDAFIREFNAQMGLQTEPVGDELLETLQKYPWPGNVRELRNVLKRILILDEPGRLAAGHFPEHIIAGRNPRTASAHEALGQATGLMPLAEVERLQILYTLEKTENNKSKAARLLGISRQTLREKLRLYEQTGGGDDLEADEAES
ncbi:MAG: sigma-54-dependent Fis family transcriptional regulator [Krumholzibacteria bacterium]|nr:sigma-54-dependent Fis family transcriptional regulator [Candidatus Krumholzibacteria bacterium]